MIEIIKYDVKIAIWFVLSIFWIYCVTRTIGFAISKSIQEHKEEENGKEK